MVSLRDLLSFRLREAALAFGSGLAAHGTEGHRWFPSVTSFP